MDNVQASMATGKMLALVGFPAKSPEEIEVSQFSRFVEGGGSVGEIGEGGGKLVEFVDRPP